MKKIKNPELKIGDRVILVYMPGEDLDSGTKGKVIKIEKSPDFGDGVNYQYRMEWYDDDDKVISTLAMIPNSDSWLYDPEFLVNPLNEAKIDNIDQLITKVDWLNLFRKEDLRYVLEYLENIRQSGIVNMFQSGEFMGVTKEYLEKYMDLHRMRRELDDNQEESIKNMLKMVDNVRSIMIGAAVKDLEQKSTEITVRGVENRLKRLSTELVKEFMTKNK
jgi:hypothetical protein